MKDLFQIRPIGVIRKGRGKTSIELYGEYAKGLSGVDGFSHLILVGWFHENDTPEKRGILQVHPRKDPQNPLTGVFGTRAPVRPNLIGLWVCRLLSVEGNRVHIEEINALDGTPVIDIKPCVEEADLMVGMEVPDWVKKRRSG